ncbi:hypothetical protein PGUG_01529, partial [Meyerozyma guilliermondii ATCC 6260]
MRRRSEQCAVQLYAAEVIYGSYWPVQASASPQSHRWRPCTGAGRHRRLYAGNYSPGRNFHFSYKSYSPHPISELIIMSFRLATRFARPAANAAKQTVATRTLTVLARSPAVRAMFTNKSSMSIGAIRGVKTINFGGMDEVVHERADWPRERLLEYFKNDTLALIGYGSQGYGQGLNLRDNGLNVIIGVRKDGASWKAAIEDGWVPGENLFEVNEAINKGTYVMNLLSDAAQSETWSSIKPLITKGKTLYFSHGFSPVFKDLTHVEPPTDVDVILAAPKGSGRTVRSLFKEGRGINSSYAVWNDVTGKAEEKAIALAVAIGSGYVYQTTFEREVNSDLYGERGCLMGGIHGMFLAQYEVLRENGHTPSEAFNETVEEEYSIFIPIDWKVRYEHTCTMPAPPSPEG